MRLVLITAAYIGMAVSTASVPLLAQLQDNTDKKLSCDNYSYGGDQSRHCEMREQTYSSIGRLDIDSGPNGGTTVKGWLRNDVLVRARVEASAYSEAAAAAMVSRVIVDGSGAQVRALGPEAARNSSWSVSYEIFVPQVTDLNVKTKNGGINVADLRGQIHFDTVNGGVNVKRVIGGVSGETVNGGIDVEFAGAPSDARQMELTTKNGGVTLAMPPQYAAHIQAEMGMGRLQSDFPLPLEANGRSRRLDFNIGAGGPPIHITTGNGSISLKHTESR